MQSSNTGVYVSPEGQFSFCDNLSMPVPAPDEVLIEVAYSGINPADVKHVVFCQARPGRPGYDFCGRVVALPVAAGAEMLEVGDLVAGYTPPGAARPERYGAHQRFLACPASCVWRVPPAIPAATAAALTTTLQTVSDVLFNCFDLPLPEKEPATRQFENGILVIWGGSTSIGLTVIQVRAFIRVNCTQLLY
jgi:NADPH:quinone reductase-like Zn-dependent oxidoreductase